MVVRSLITDDGKRPKKDVIYLIKGLGTEIEEDQIQIERTSP